MVFSMNVFKNKTVGKIKKNVKKRKKRALNKNVKNVFYIYAWKDWRFDTTPSVTDAWICHNVLE